MQRWLRPLLAVSVCLATLVPTGVAFAQADPPARVGRISYLAGTVSFHDADDANWSQALVNYPFTTGGALWTQPDGRAEMVVAGTRLRLQGATEIEALALDDDSLRLRLSQGRIDVRVTGVPSDRPYEILTPRGTVLLLRDGDYMIEAGTSGDPTRIGVRSGIAQFIEAAGTTQTIGAGETGLVSGFAPMAFTLERAMPPPMPSEWAARDRVMVYRGTPEYVSPTVTGAEDLAVYGTWTSSTDYGQMWVPSWVPVGWLPYSRGRWVYVRPWGWTWIDDAPWGFVPFHYGSWVYHGRRWCWVPPARSSRPIYAPAVVGFVGGSGPLFGGPVGARRPAVGWFPLGPREVYVPSYTSNRAYIRNLNLANGANAADIDRRVAFAERQGDRRDDRRDERRDGERWTHANQRHATIVPADAFARSEPVARTALRVPGDEIARLEAAPVAAPPLAAPPAGAPATPPDRRAPDTKGAGTKGPPPAADVPAGHTTFGNMPTIGRPERSERRPAPGPAITRAPSRQESAPAVPPGAGQTAPPPAAPKAGTPDAKPATPPPSTVTAPPPAAAPPRSDLPPLRERPSGVQATPKAPAGTTAAPPVPPPAMAPKAPDRVGPPPAAPPPASQPTPGAAPKPPVERIAPPPPAPAPSAGPRPPDRIAPAPGPVAPAPSPGLAPKPVERVGPPPAPPPPPPAPRPASPPPVAAPATAPAPPPPPPPQQQQQQQQQRDDQLKGRR